MVSDRYGLDQRKENSKFPWIPGVFQQGPPSKLVQSSEFSIWRSKFRFKKIVSVYNLKPRGDHFLYLEADNGKVAPSAQCMQMN